LISPEEGDVGSETTYFLKAKEKRKRGQGSDFNIEFFKHFSLPHHPQKLLLTLCVGHSLP
jgi:hypothetical protein